MICFLPKVTRGFSSFYKWSGAYSVLIKGGIQKGGSRLGWGEAHAGRWSPDLPGWSILENFFEAIAYCCRR